MLLSSNPLRMSLVTASRALFGGSLAAGQIEGGVDQGDVRERLRKVPELAPEAGIIFLRQEADIVLKGQEALEQITRLAGTPLQNEVVGEPKAAGQKRSFARRQAIGHLSSVVATDEPVCQQSPLDCADGADDAWVSRRQKADQRQQQQASVERFRSVSLNKAAEVGVERLVTDVLVDPVTYLSPARQRAAGTATLLEHFDHPIERHPHHHLRMSEVLRRTAHLPDAFVRLIPNLGQMSQRHAPNRVPVLIRGQPV